MGFCYPLENILLFEVPFPTGSQLRSTTHSVSSLARGDRFLDSARPKRLHKRGQTARTLE